MENTPKKDAISFDLDDLLDNEEDDMVKIHLNSSIIQFNYLQLFKYSQLVREMYPKDKIEVELSQFIRNIQSQYNINIANINLFFKLFQKKRIEMSSCQYCDLCKLSEIFKCKSLIKFLDDYSKKNSDNIDFIINTILELNSTINDDALINNTFSVKLENYLRSNFKKCIQNQNFSRLPISLIYRIIEKLDPNLILYDDLYDFISKSISDRHTLFSFIDLKQLSDEKFDDLYKKYTTKKDSEVIYYKFLQIDLEFINTMKENEKKLKILSNEVQKENNKLSSSNKLLEQQIKSLKDKNDEITKENQELTTKVSQLQIQNKELVDANKPDEKIIKSLISFISTNQTLCSLCESQNLELIKFFLTYNTNTVNSKYCHESIEKIPLTIAIEKGNIELVKLLLSIPNIDVNVLLTTYYTKQNIQQSNIGSNGERIDARETIIKKRL